MQKPNRHFGLQLLSVAAETCTSNVLSDDGTPIKLCFGEVPSSLPAATSCSAFCDVTCDEVIYRLPGIADYHVRKSGITACPATGANQETVEYFLMGPALALLLQLQGIVVLQGSAVLLPDGSAAIFCGISTSGKSTIAAALERQGHPVLADDFIALRRDAQGRFWLLPGQPHSKLSESALRVLQYPDNFSQLQRARPGLDKFVLPQKTSLKPAIPSHLYELHIDDSKPLAFNSISGLNRITTLASHIHQWACVKAMGHEAETLNLLLSLAPVLNMHRITRPQRFDDLSAITAQILLPRP